MKYMVSITLCMTTLFLVGVIPFGGTVTMQRPCNTGLLLTLKTSKGLQDVMWSFGNLRYLSRVPPHVGQNLLGMLTAPAPCILGVPPFATYLGGGPVIDFHGASI